MGPCDNTRYNALDEENRDFLDFESEFCLNILKKRPYQSEALQVAANALTAMGYYEDGLKYDLRLYEMHPGDALVAYNLACSLALMSRNEEALERLEQAICLGYNDKKHILDDPDLEVLRPDPRFHKLLEQTAH